MPAPCFGKTPPDAASQIPFPNRAAPIPRELLRGGPPKRARDESLMKGQTAARRLSLRLRSCSIPSGPHSQQTPAQDRKRLPLLAALFPDLPCRSNRRPPLPRRPSLAPPLPFPICAPTRAPAILVSPTPEQPVPQNVRWLLWKVSIALP